MANFVDPFVEEREESVMPDAEILRASRFPLAQKWCHPPANDLARLEEKIRNTPLLSCHSFYRFHNLWTLRMKRKHGIPYWFVPHGGLDPYVMKSGSLAKNVFLALGGREFLHQASCILFSTELEWRKAEHVFGPLQGEVVPWPVDLPEEVPDKARSRIRSQLGIMQDELLLLYFGRIHSMKRPLETIETVAARDPGNLHLLILGPEGDVSQEMCREKAAEIGYERLHLQSPVYGSEKWEWLSSADGYISLSHRENFNHAAAESLSMGIPVLLSKGNDLSEWIPSSDCGWCAIGDSPHDWCQLVDDFLCAATSVRMEKGKKGKELVRKKFSFSEFRRRLQFLLRTYGRS